jgi:hypothetical protein
MISIPSRPRRQTRLSALCCRPFHGAAPAPHRAAASRDADPPPLVSPPLLRGRPLAAAVGPSAAAAGHVRVRPRRSPASVGAPDATPPAAPAQAPPAPAPSAEAAAAQLRGEARDRLRRPGGGNAGCPRRVPGAARVAAAAAGPGRGLLLHTPHLTTSSPRRHRTPSKLRDLFVI